jgi:hypothetical protein
MYSVQEENSFEVAKELFTLNLAHYNEVETKAPVIPLNINWDTVKLLFENDLVSLVVARKDGEVVGYFANLIAEDFLTSRLEAKELGIYIHPDHRGGRLFIKLQQVVEECLRSRNVATQYITFKTGHNTLLPIRLGFQPTEMTFQKILET